MSSADARDLLLLGRAKDISARLKQAEDHVDSLAEPTWEQLWAQEVEVELDLLKRAEELVEIGSFLDASELFETVSELNDQLASTATALGGSPASAERDLEELAEQGQSAAATATFIRAQARLTVNLHHRLVGNLSAAAESATSARDLFRSLVDTDSEDEDSTRFEVMALFAEGLRLAAIAQTEWQRLRYDEAALTFLNAKGALDQASARLQASPGLDILPTIDSDVAEFDSAHRQALFWSALTAGQMEDALAQGSAAVALLGTSLDSPGLPPLARRLTEVNREYYEGQLAYVGAEVAADRQDWVEAERLLSEARDIWRRTVEKALGTGIQSARQQAENVQAISAQVLASCRRRIAGERSLHTEIARLKADILRLEYEIFRLAGKPTIGSTGGVNLSEQHAGGDIVGRDKVAGDNIRAGHDVVGGDQVTSGGDVDFSKVWQEHSAEIDLGALAGELETLRLHLESVGGGERDSEIGAVAAAQLAASKGDGPGALRWLKAAGKWVLDRAQDLAVPIATAAARAVLGS